MGLLFYLHMYWSILSTAESVLNLLFTTDMVAISNVLQADRLVNEIFHDELLVVDSVVARALLKHYFDVQGRCYLWQASSSSFNRGMLMNIGFMEAMKQRRWHCFIFHDVDLLPENDKNIYSCPGMPRHMSVGVDTMAYRSHVTLRLLCNVKFKFKIYRRQ